ncbi:methylenetetrahydrofolate reductase [Naasia lichenicola]|nr:methylenetetrahydrofolate reductase [Naasia lichenicola]
MSADGVTTSGQGVAKRRTLNGVLSNMGYEVLPFKATEDNVVKFVPKSVRLTVTASPPKGIEATIALAEKFAGHGYSVAPHLSAKMIRDKVQLGEFVQRLKAVGIDSVFVVGGDAEEPAGEYTDALSLLKSLDSIGHEFTSIGIGGYPEGHHFIPQDGLDAALKEKAQLATYIATQICYDAPAIISWARRIKSEGVDLPIRVGMPGAVSREKLLRISLASGVGDSLKFLQKQKGMFWRFFVPGGYSPNKLIRGLKPAIGAADNNLQDFHIFTFNELEGTEAWRKQMLQRYPS